jgi:hypothetical protein
MGSSRRGWLHGVDVRRRTTNGPGDWRASEVLLRRICLRYEDGRKVCFVPEAGEEFFSQDDAHRVVGMLHKGSEVPRMGSEVIGEASWYGTVRHRRCLKFGS